MPKHPPHIAPADILLARGTFLTSLADWLRTNVPVRLGPTSHSAEQTPRIVNDLIKAAENLMEAKIHQARGENVPIQSQKRTLETALGELRHIDPAQYKAGQSRRHCEEIGDLADQIIKDCLGVQLAAEARTL
jgi:hypothetical protein